MSSVVAILNVLPFEKQTLDELFLFYNILRGCLILVNIVLAVMITAKVNQMKLRENDPINALIQRLRYFPVIQIITRFGPCVYEFYYGKISFDSNQFDSTSFTLQKRTFLWLFSLTAPSTGIGFFFVFLMMQPNAYKCLRAKVCTMLSIVPISSSICYCFCYPQNKKTTGSGRLSAFGTTLSAILDPSIDQDDISISEPFVKGCNNKGVQQGGGGCHSTRSKRENFLSRNSKD